MRKLIFTVLVIFGSMSTASAHDSRYYERRVQVDPGTVIAGALVVLGAAAIIAGGNQHHHTYVEPRRGQRWQHGRYRHQPRGYRYEQTINCRGHLSYDSRRGQYYDTRTGLSCSGR